jgi:hypothetical protein
MQHHIMPINTGFQRHFVHCNMTHRRNFRHLYGRGAPARSAVAQTSGSPAIARAQKSGSGEARKRAAAGGANRPQPAAAKNPERPDFPF